MINKIKNYLKKFYRIIIYNIFFYKYGEIKGVIYSDQDNRVKVQSLELGNKHNYKIYKITNGRLYTDRVHDTAIILDNSIVSGPSFQLRDNKNESAERNMILKKELLEL